MVNNMVMQQMVWSNVHFLARINSYIQHSNETKWLDLQNYAQERACIEKQNSIHEGHTYTYITNVSTYITYVGTYIRTCMYVHTLHTYVHSYIHTYIHTYIHSYIHTTNQPKIQTYIQTYIHAYIHVVHELRLFEDLSIRHTSICTDFHPQERVVSIHKGHEDHREEALVVVVQGAALGRFPDGHMPAICRAPTHEEHSTCFWRPPQYVSILLEWWGRSWPHPCIPPQWLGRLQGWWGWWCSLPHGSCTWGCGGLVTWSQESHSDGHLQAWRWRLPHLGILLLYPWPHSLHQVIKRGRLHPEVAEEGLWVFYSKHLHQSGVMFIRPPPLLCQPWSGLISSGSSPGLLHISFKQVLVEDSNLEQTNMVQGFHTLWWLGWDWWKC